MSTDIKLYPPKVQQIENLGNKTKLPPTKPEPNFADIKLDKKEQFIPFLAERDHMGRLQSSKSNIEEQETSKLSQKQKIKKIKQLNKNRVKYSILKEDLVVEKLPFELQEVKQSSNNYKILTDKKKVKKVRKVTKLAQNGQK